MLSLPKIEKVLLFLIILLLPTQLGKHFWPQFSFIYSLPIDYLSPTLYFWDILVIILLIVFLILGKHINRTAINLFYFFILTQSLSLLFVSDGQSIGVGFVRLEQYLIAGLFGVYIASTDFKKIIFWALTLAIIGESFLAIGQFIKNGDLGFWIFGERSFSISTPGIAKFDFYGRQFLRPYATFPHPNVLAAFMVLAIVIVNSITSLRGRSETTDEAILSFKRLPRSLHSKVRWTFSLAMTAGFLAGLTTLLTVSRTAILAGIFSAIFLLKKKGRLLLALGCLLLLPILYTRFSSLLNFDNLTLIRREQLSEVAFSLWFRSPLFGVGLNNFIPAASGSLLIGASRFLQPAHNIFLLALSETGIIGLLGWLVLLLTSCHSERGQRPSVGILTKKDCHVARRLVPRNDNFGMTMVWLVVIFLGMFDHYFLTLPQGYRLLFLIWGLSFNMLE